jgi:membrane protein insertase Oxa1/YidC/SpoIIIJ
MSGFASGLVIYWTVNSTLGVIQQMIIMKSMNVPIHLFSKDKMKAKLEKEIEEGPIVEPSLQILEGKIEDAIVPEGEPRIVSMPKPKKKKKK